MTRSSRAGAQRRRYDRLDTFLDGVAQAVYPEPLSLGHEEITRQAWERLQGMCPLPPGARVLDVGCGQGVGLARFREAGLSAVGVTLSEADLAACEREGHQVVRMDQSFLDFPPDEFALVWCRHCLEHSIAPFFTLAEFRRVLTPGGLLYVEVPGPDTSCRHEWNPNHYSVLGREAWLALLTRAGFTVLDAFNINHQTGSGPDIYFGFVARRTGAAAEHPATRFGREHVTLGFEAHGETLRIELELDRDRPRDRPILEALEAGGFHQPELAYFITNVLNAGDTMVDVGAHVGYFTALAGRVVGPSGRVYSLEEEAEHHRRLEGHLQLNGLENVAAYNASPGRPDRPTLDTLLAGLEPGRGPRLIRISTGGSEYQVLKGALRTIMAHEVPWIICDIDPEALARRGTSEMQLREFMRLIGYRAALLRPDATGLEPLPDEQAVDSGPTFNLLFFRS